MKDIALVIGRFQPFHNGHLHIIRKLVEEGFKVKIGIGSPSKYSQIKDPFTKEERDIMISLAMMEINIRHFEIYYIEDQSADKEWIREIKQTTGKFDLVVSGNLWVQQCFEEYFPNIKIRKYKEEKDRFKGISATNIRNRWLEAKSKQDLPIAVYNFLKSIKAHERIKKINFVNSQ